MSLGFAAICAVAISIEGVAYSDEVNMDQSDFEELNKSAVAFMNELGSFAAPRVLNARLRDESPVEMLRSLSSLTTEFLNRAGSLVGAKTSSNTTLDPMIRLQACANDLQRFLKANEKKTLDDVRSDLQTRARECLRSFGVTDPPGGWDALEPPRDDEE